MVVFPKKELLERTKCLQNKMIEQGFDATIIVQNTDLYYFTGSCQSGHLIIPSSGKPIYLVRKSLERARTESSLSDIYPQNSFKNMSNILRTFVSPGGKIGLELDVLPVNIFKKYLSVFNDFILEDISPLVKEVRMIKSPLELSLIKKAADMAATMFKDIPAYLHKDKTEIAFAGELESVFRRLGHCGYIRMRGFNQEIFYGHIMSGENLTYPSFLDSPTGGVGVTPAYPQSVGLKKIKMNEPVMVDYVANYHGYLVDKARLFCLGELPPELDKAHQAALFIQNEIAKAARPGVVCSYLYHLSLSLAKEMGLEDNFMGTEENKVSFIAHGIGLEVDELPVFAKNYEYPLQNNMVFSMEPKMFFPNIGIVGIENTFVVTESGAEKLTIFPDNIFYL
jgi:Xaa-Pro dipeptidase